LTGPDIEERQCIVHGATFTLIRPEAREQEMTTNVIPRGPFISIDYTHPSAVNDNAEFYCRHDLPFVMGTTGGDRQALVRTVENSSITAVIAPNMAKQIVGFQAIMAYAAETFPNLFKGYHLSIEESHQAGKADTSGTAKAMVSYFNRMGIPFEAEQIQMERDPDRQQEVWGIPKQYLSGHAWHTYTLISPDQTARFQFKHNVNGREIYAEGTMDAAAFLARKVSEGKKGKVYTMIDVLESSRNN
jgi:4-hydroxy-tetrahydrodipicolinate reductase